MNQRRLVFGVIPSIHEVPPRDPSRGGGAKNGRVPNGPVQLVQAHARWTATTTLRRKPRQPKGPGRQSIWIVIPEKTRGTNRPMLRTWTTEEATTHAGGLDPHRR
ncbi:hypothetical protein BHM03_00058567 [Ensete ventricosum]|nr:hypothetical protein BHM03_00058567 [Ensete ventricosum]